MKKTLRIYFAAFLLLCVSAVSHTAFAQVKDGPPKITDNVGIHSVIENPFKIDGDIYDVIGFVIQNVVIPLAGVVATLAFIWSGFMFVTAQGNETKLKKAKDALLYTAVGTAVLFGAWVIAQIIQTTLQQISNI